MTAKEMARSCVNHMDGHTIIEQSVFDNRIQTLAKLHPPVQAALDGKAVYVKSDKQFNIICTLEDIYL